MGSVLQFQTFDAEYIEALRAGDMRVQEHFVCYFTHLLNLKLRSRLRSPQAIEDVRQETFLRVIVAIQEKGSLRQPDRLGPFVNTVCNNVLQEHYRKSGRADSLDEDDAPDPPSRDPNTLDMLMSNETQQIVRRVLAGLNHRNRSLLHAVFIEERDRDDICREFGVDRDYLRVRILRAKEVFKAAYLKSGKDTYPFPSPVGEA